MEHYSGKRPESTPIPASGLTGDGLELVLDEIFAALPEGEALYPTDLTTTQTERFFVAEMVREKLLLLTRNELPYTTGVLVELLEEEERLLRVAAVIYVERPSQKGIVIGKGGRMIKAIGQAAREELERLLGTRLYLELHVKVQPRWRDDARVLTQMTPGMADLSTGEAVDPTDET